MVELEQLWQGCVPMKSVDKGCWENPEGKSSGAAWPILFPEGLEPGMGSCCVFQTSHCACTDQGVWPGLSAWKWALVFTCPGSTVQFSISHPTQPLR